MTSSLLRLISAAALLASLPVTLAQTAAPGVPKGTAATAEAGTTSVHLDPARTTVTFTAGTLHRIHGTFQLKTGVFAIDSKSGMAQGEILVDAASEKSNDAKLDSRLQGETLETVKYPGIFFHAEKVSGHLPARDGTQHLKLSGSFNIHGSDHPLTVDVEASQAGSDLLLRSTFTVPYVDWGMKDASTLLMRDHNIKITVESHATSEALHPNT